MLGAPRNPVAEWALNFSDDRYMTKKGYARVMNAIGMELLRAGIDVRTPNERFRHEQFLAAKSRPVGPAMKLSDKPDA